MARSVLYMSMSLDGFIAGPNDTPDNPGGDGFMRLHDWFIGPDGKFGEVSGAAREVYEEMRDFSAILAGRNTVEQVDHWGGERNGVQIIVPSWACPR
ncbi:dihydrofolate reductase family protein [Kribbella sp. NPDC051620]|uniref:dihydrofolate reductase family protein n=1 Tax=Kribbella sp. NPDC051620 TaxID=3364120 RepID=UPI0037AD7F11